MRGRVVAGVPGARGRRLPQSGGRGKGAAACSARGQTADARVDDQDQSTAMRRSAVVAMVAAASAMTVARERPAVVRTPSSAGPAAAAARGRFVASARAPRPGLRMVSGQRSPVRAALPQLLLADGRWREAPRRLPAPAASPASPPRPRAPERVLVRAQLVLPGPVQPASVAMVVARGAGCAPPRVAAVAAEQVAPLGMPLGTPLGPHMGRRAPQHLDRLFEGQAVRAQNAGGGGLAIADDGGKDDRAVDHFARRLAGCEAGALQDTQ